MTADAYAAFLPPDQHGAADRAPQRTWWEWRGHRVHIARARRPEAAARVVVVHGAGAHAGALWPLAALVADRGLDVAAVDLPLYGRTTSPDPRAVRYADWVGLLLAFVEAERDGRPLLLLGASMGGLLALEVGARSDAVDAVAATSLLDPRDRQVAARLSRFGRLGVLGRPLSTLACGAIARARTPMSALADLSRMSRDPALSVLCALDPRGGAARVPLGFLASFLRYEHADPATVTVPVTLLHPARDDWTPAHLSERYLARLSGPTAVALLPECGHFPIEQPGVGLLVDRVTGLAEGLADRPGR